MSRKWLLFSILLVVSNLTFAQSYNETSFDDSDDWGNPFSFMDDTTPFIEISYGFGQLKHENFSGSFADPGLLELKLGYSDSKERSNNYLVKTSSSFMFVSHVSTDLSDNEALDKVSSSLWRFGVGVNDGFGYEFNNISIIPYHQCGASWAQVDFDEIEDGNIALSNGTEQLSAGDYEILKLYDKSYRFGTISEGGVKLGFSDFISFNAGYEASVIYPRFLTWKQGGSFLIKLIGAEGVNHFIDDVADASPAAGPIVSFVLKNAYSYAFYQLQKDNMSWPFSTEAPLTYETFKIGVTFTF